MPVCFTLTYEREMLPALGSALSQTIFPRGVEPRIFREVGVCGVIPDVLLCRWDSIPTDPPRRPVTIVEAHILALVERAANIRPQKISRELYLSEQKLEDSIRKLVKQRFLTQRSNGRLALNGEARTDTVELVAVEMKLNRWREALAQARSYLTFANSAYVVLDGARALPERAVRSEFRRHGVGLLLQYGSSLHLLVNPRRRKIRATPERFIVMHKLLGLLASEPGEISPLPESVQPDALVHEVCVRASL